MYNKLKLICKFNKKMLAFTNYKRKKNNLRLAVIGQELTSIWQHHV